VKGFDVMLLILSIHLNSPRNPSRASEQAACLTFRRFVFHCGDVWSKQSRMAPLCGENKEWETIM